LELEVLSITKVSATAFALRILAEFDGEDGFYAYITTVSVPELTNLTSLRLDLPAPNRYPKLTGDVINEEGAGATTNDTALTFSGTLGGVCVAPSLFDTHRVCHLPDTGEVFEVGDQWVGSFTCADNTFIERTTRIDFVVYDVSDDGNTFRALYDFTVGEGSAGRSV
jgi:hypothetical protein